MKTLGVLTTRLRAAGLLLDYEERFDDNPIDHLAGDSREVGPDGLFAAVRGTKSDGHVFIDKAVQNGAKAIVCEAMPENREKRYPGIAFVHVTRARNALAELASAFYDDPSRDLRMVGVTGTNGKTTVTFLIHHVLMRLARRAGLIGTIEARVGDDVLKTDLTTPGPIALQRLLRQMVEAGCTTCTMEVSSHALDQDRVGAIAFYVGVYTNLTRDHIDYHGTLDAYRDAKKRLFDDLSPAATAIYNADDAEGAAVVADTRAARRSYAIEVPADIHVRIVENGMDGLVLHWVGRNRRFRLVGRFNAYNLMAAYGAVCALGHDASDVLTALESAPPVPGRFELISFDDGTRVVVDYAHTPDALENVLQTIVEAKDDASHLWCVFGCGGDRDREKRPMMGAVAERYADHLVVTSDNPRSEAPTSILNDIRDGLTRPDRAQYIVDRRQAIEAAAGDAAPGDIVLVAGRGHEAYQTIGSDKIPFDDRKVVREAFSARRGPRPADSG